MAERGVAPALVRARPDARCDRCGYSLAALFEQGGSPSPLFGADEAWSVTCPECGLENAPAWHGRVGFLELLGRVAGPSATAALVGVATLVVWRVAVREVIGAEPRHDPGFVLVSAGFFGVWGLSVVWAATLLSGRSRRYAELTRWWVHARWRVSLSRRGAVRVGAVMFGIAVFGVMWGGLLLSLLISAAR